VDITFKLVIVKKKITVLCFYCINFIYIYIYIYIEDDFIKSESRDNANGTPQHCFDGMSAAK